MWGGVFYGGLVAALAGIGFDVWPALLPMWLAGPVTRNSEGLLLAVLLAGWIEVTRLWLAGADGWRRWTVTVAAASGCLLVAFGLLSMDFPVRFRTLNEAFLAAAVLFPVLQVRRIPPVWFGVLASLVVVFAVASTSRSGVAVDLAEALGVLLLAPVGFWVVDRSMLDRRMPASPAMLRIGWYA